MPVRKSPPEEPCHDSQPPTARDLYHARGGPCFWVEFPPPLGPHAYASLETYFAGLIASLPERPRAIVLASAHWEEPVPTVSTAGAPPMLYDYYGFPAHTYQLRYPAPGSPELAARVRDLLTLSGESVASDDRRGFDHGVFVPMLIIDPEARIPLVMLSLAADLDPGRHLAIGAALGPLREEGVLVIGSGSSYHNLRAIFSGGEDHASTRFDDWLNAAVTQRDVARRRQALIDWRAAPGALECHPRPEHLIPLMVAAGAAGDDLGRASFRDRIGGKAYSCFTFGG